MNLFKFLLFSISVSCFSQVNIDYYTRDIDTSDTHLKVTYIDSLRLSSLDSLIKYTQNKDLHQYVNYIESYVDIALKNKLYNKAAEKAIKGSYAITTQLGQPERTLRMLKKVEQYSSLLNRSYLIGGIYLKKGGGNFNSGNFKDAIKDYSMAIDSYTEKDSIFKADALFFRGQVYFEIGMHISAVQDFKLATSYYENLGDLDYVFFTMGSIINVYGANGFTEKTILERDELIKKKIATNSKSGLYTEYFNQSISYRKLGRTDKQEEYLLKALQQAKTEDTLTDNITFIYSSLVKLYLENNEIQKATQLLDITQKKLKNVDATTATRFAYQLSKCYYLLKTKKLNEALSLSKKLLRQVTKNNRVESIIELNELIYKIYNAMHNSKQALKYHLVYAKLKDSIYNITKTNALAYYQTLYETELKEKEIYRQKNAIQSLARGNDAKRRLITFGSIGVILSFLVFYLIRNRLLLKRKKILREKFSQKLLLSQEEERRRISKDLHDGLGQSLLLIKNKIATTKNKKTEELLNNAIEEMRNVSHSLYPFQLNNIGISCALENLVMQLDESCENTFIFGDIDDINNMLTKDQEVNIFRIVQECLSNIIKHAKADSAKVSLVRVHNCVKLTIKDNGIGFVFSEKYKDLKSLGLKTIKERVRFLKGSLKINSSKNDGTVFKIIFPINK